MPQSSKRKREYAKDRYLREGAKLREQAAAWRKENREHLKERSRQRRLIKRAMCLVAAARIRARRKNVAFSLTIDDINEIQRVIDDGHCQLSGVKFTMTGSRSPTSPSLDRIVPSLGYTGGNVRVVCHALNVGMADWGEDALFAIVSAWMAHRGSKTD